MREMPIENRIQLQKKIMELNSMAFEQEEMMKHAIKELHFSLQPSTLVNRWLARVKNDHEIRSELMRTGKDVALNFAANVFLKRGNLLSRGILLLLIKRLTKRVFKKSRSANADKPNKVVDKH